MWSGHSELLEVTVTSKVAYTVLKKTVYDKTKYACTVLSTGVKSSR